MKSLFNGFLTVAAAVLLLDTASDANAQMPPQQANQAFYQQQMDPRAQMPPGMPASPLAGGRAAAQGNSFVNVHGDPIVMQAQYMDGGGCGPGYGGDCYGGGYAPCDDGSGDAWVSFGGCTADQSGPHYFDVMASLVYLKADDMFGDVGPLASIGVDGPRILDPSNSTDEYEPGWQIALRVDLGPLSVFEATYMGLYDIGYSETVNSVDVAPGGQDFQLFAPPGFGQPAPIPGVDFGSTYSVRLESDLQSTELSYRRYWVGKSPRVSGTYLLGFRYVRLTEDFAWLTEALDDPGLQTTDTSTRLWSSENDLLGFQLGGDGWISVLQGLRLGCEGKAGVYNNRFKFSQISNFAATAGAPSDYDVRTEGNDVAFVGEGSVSVVADILPSWSIRGGYRVLYLNSLATVGNTIDTTTFGATGVDSNADALVHGFDASIEYIW